MSGKWPVFKPRREEPPVTVETVPAGAHHVREPVFVPPGVRLQDVTLPPPSGGDDTAAIQAAADAAAVTPATRAAGPGKAPAVTGRAPRAKATPAAGEGAENT